MLGVDGWVRMVNIVLLPKVRMELYMVRMKGIVLSSDSKNGEYSEGLGL